MDRAAYIVKGWTGPSSEEVVLDYEDRHRRRIVLTSTKGTEFLLDLAQVPDLRDGDAIKLLSGAVVLVRAAPEALMEIRAKDPIHLARIAYHIGNRHLAAEIDGEKLRIRADHVIADMIRGLDGEVSSVTAPFNPEGGAYGHGQVHGHEHTHPHSHESGHGHREHHHHE